MLTQCLPGILIPFAGTTLGSACVFFMKKTLHEGVQRALTGFAAGVMVAASIWSLLIPAMEQVRGPGAAGVHPRHRGLLAGHRLFAAAGYGGASSAPGCRHARRPPQRLFRAPRCWCWPSRCTTSPRAWPSAWCTPGHLTGSASITGDGCAGAVPGHCHPELPGGCHHFHAPAGGRHEKRPGVLGRRTLSGIVEPIGRSADDLGRRASWCPRCPICSALPPEPCCMWWWRS